MEHYEVLFIIPGAITDEAALETIAKVKKLLEDLGGRIDNEENWGRKNLAYKISRETQGTYGLFTFEIEPAKIAEINKRMQLSREILRHLVVKAHVKTEAELAQEAKVKEKINAKKKEEVKQELQAAEQEEATAQQPGKKVEEAKPVVKAEKKEESKLSMEDLDKKLDELLNEELE